MKFKEGQVYECVYSELNNIFTVGKRYEVKYNGKGLAIYSNGGTPYNECELSGANVVKFKLAEKEN